jgi:hypothetical protein
MPQIRFPSGRAPARCPLYLLGVSSVALALSLTACHDDDGVGSGRAGSPNVAGAAGASAGSTGATSEAGAGGVSNEAGAAGDLTEGGAAGEGGALPISRCEAGGALFVAGNYADATRSLLLRTTATAATLALVPKAAVSSTSVPQLFLVERSCTPGGAVIARDESAHYRVEFQQSESRLQICFAKAATLEAALLLEPGCGANAVLSLTQEAL